MNSKKSLKILVYSETFLPSLGGLERNSFTLCNTLFELGYKVTLATATTNKDNNSYKFSLVRTSKLFRIIKIMITHDLLIINGGVALKVIFPAFLLRKKYIIVYQSSELYNRRSFNLMDKINNLIRKFFAEKATMNITTSSFALDNLQLKNKINQHLLNPIDKDLEMMVTIISKNEFIKEYDILFAGRLIEGKGIFLLAEALIKLNHKHHFKVAFAGEGIEKGRLSEYLIHNNIKAEFLGRVDQFQLLESYKKSKLLVVPSTTHIEGNPLVIAEAISCFTPVLVSDQNAMIEAVGSAGLSFKSGSCDELMIALELIFANNERGLKELAENCKNEYKKFSFETYKLAIKETLSSLNLY